MTRIVSASCMNVEASDKQPVWKEAAAHKPEWLILCGDHIYMDYSPSLNQSRPWTLEKFAVEMQRAIHPSTRRVIHRPAAVREAMSGTLT